MDFFPVVEEVYEPNRFLVVLSIIIFFTALVLWPLGWFFRLPRMNKSGAEIPKYRPFFTFSRYYTIIMVILSLVTYFFLRKHADLINTNEFPAFSPDISSGFRLLISLPTLLSILLIGQLVILIPVWSQRHGTMVFRYQYSLVVLALIAYTVFLISWNLVVPGQYLSHLL